MKFQVLSMNNRNGNIFLEILVILQMLHKVGMCCGERGEIAVYLCIIYK